MLRYGSDADAALWEGFTGATLLASEWNHRCHLRVALLHTLQWTIDEAHVRMRVGIIRLNARHGLEETITRGYHETLTRFWLVAVASRMRESGDPIHSEAFCDAHPDLVERGYPLRFYTHERLFSAAARAVFVAPDVMPLPAIAG